jgi:DNA-binding NarL/FixJ family response regulator
MPEHPVRVVLANDDRIIIEGLRAMLAPYSDHVVVVGTADGDPEIAMAPDIEADADVMLIDAFWRRAGGVDAAVKVLAQDPPFAVAVFTDADALRVLLQALRMGVGGYLLKSA